MKREIRDQCTAVQSVGSPRSRRVAPLSQWSPSVEAQKVSLISYRMLRSTLAPVTNPASQETSKDPREVEERKAGLKSGRKADKERGTKGQVGHPQWRHEKTCKPERLQGARSTLDR